MRTVSLPEGSRFFFHGKQAAGSGSGEYTQEAMRITSSGVEGSVDLSKLRKLYSKKTTFDTLLGGSSHLASG